jgi:hypothetical protein
MSRAVNGTAMQITCSVGRARFVISLFSDTAQRKFRGKWQPKLEGFDVALGHRFPERQASHPCPLRRPIGDLLSLSAKTRNKSTTNCKVGDLEGFPKTFLDLETYTRP